MSIGAEPDSNNRNNYLFDTNVINMLACDEDLIKICEKLMDLGFSYYIADVQERELKGTPDRSMQYDDIEAWHPSKYLNEIKSMANLLNIQSVSCIALGYRNFSKVDGSMRFPPTSGKLFDMFVAIHNNNHNHLRDATIAEAAVYHHCILVTNDNRPRNKVNSFFSGRAISYENFKEYCNKMHMSMEL